MWLFGIGYFLKVFRGFLLLFIVVMIVWLLVVFGSCGFIGFRLLFLLVYENWYFFDFGLVWILFFKKEYKNLILCLDIDL